MDEIISKAQTLIEALPYIKKFHNKTVIIKYGGSAMIDQKLKETVILDIILMKFVGINPVIIHGGGKAISSLMKKLDKEVLFVDGYRFTDKETMDITEMVLTGQINKEIVALINHNGGKGVGISGKDGNLIKAKKKDIMTKDLGFVGDIIEINPEILNVLDNNGFIPIVSPVAIGENGETYNINADIVASEIAIKLNASKIIYITDVKGIYKDFEKSDEIYHTLTYKGLEKLIDEGKIQGGMIPKLDACLKALARGIEKIHIIDGKIQHSILLEIFTSGGVGTEIILR